METDKKIENLACAFAISARLIQREGEGLESHSLIMAANVNAGLAIELYAKCLSQLAAGHYHKSHRLEKVLAKLPAPMQSELQKAFEGSITEETRKQIRQVETQSGAKVDIDFHSVVINWPRFFVETRYWFEPAIIKSSLSTFFFEELVHVLGGAIEKRRES